MDCPYCRSTCTTQQLQHTTDLGYAVFRCKDCHCTFNARTGVLSQEPLKHKRLTCSRID